MKQLIIGGLIMLFSNLATAGDAFEVVSLKFNEGVSLEEQKKLMMDLNRIVKKFDGFKSRDYYYSSENGRWIDFVVWSDVKLAKKASEQIMIDPAAGALVSKMEEKSMIFSHYERVGGVKKDK
ncbi:MAG: hypothetical protein LW875_09740 [Proteobacteria bacterium]|jgi:hypothetical protein|nr:hypothetical protein [Pseudomonadota bacterium]